MQMDLIVAAGDTELERTAVGQSPWHWAQENHREGLDPAKVLNHMESLSFHGSKAIFIKFSCLR